MKKTQEQIEQEVRAVGRMCRGPHRRKVAAVVKDLAKAIKAAPDSEVALEGGAGWYNEDVSAILLACKTTQEVVAVLLEAGQYAAASFCDAAARRPGCGQDVNDLMLAAGKFDGEEQEVECPRCKTVIKYTPANYEADVEPVEA